MTKSTFTKIEGTSNCYVEQFGRKFFLCTKSFVDGSIERMPTPGGGVPKVFKNAAAVEADIRAALARRAAKNKR